MHNIGKKIYQSENKYDSPVIDDGWDSIVQHQSAKYTDTQTERRQNLYAQESSSIELGNCIPELALHTVLS